MEDLNELKDPKMKEVQLTRLITNQLIIGKSYQSGNIVTIEDPYECHPTAEGIQMIPFDKHIIGKDLPYVQIDNSNTLYTSPVSDELRNLYLTTISGIIPEPEKKIIL